MKKNLISLAVAASVLGGAAAQAQMHVSPDKTGEVLMFPLYSADTGNATNITIVNTTGAAKAVKVRFLEHKNSDEVLDFNLYLSKYDTFAFAVLPDPNGVGGAIQTRDNTCTVPQLGSPNPPLNGTTVTNPDGSKTRTQPFTNFGYSKDFNGGLDRGLTGHIEIIEMGVLVNEVALPNVGATPTQKAQQFASFATHGANGVPANCAGLVSAWDKGLFGTPDVAGAATPGVTAPTGGLYGTAYQINVDKAVAFGFEPTALDNWAPGSLHKSPGTEDPKLADGVSNAVIYGNTGVYTAVVANSGIEAVSAVLMTESVSNDVNVNPFIDGMTDWVVTFPTKQNHVDFALKANVIKPFTDNWVGKATVSAGVYKEDQACETVTVTQYDREEQTTFTSGIKFSPSIPGTDAEICNETAVINMGATGGDSALDVETGLTYISPAYAEGWQQMVFKDNSMSVTSGNNTINLKGLPAIGFAAYKVGNGAMSYGNATEHKRSSANVVSAG
jgi:hypothetical protein